jgi:hypothetical protein
MPPEPELQNKPPLQNRRRRRWWPIACRGPCHLDARPKEVKRLRVQDCQKHDRASAFDAQQERRPMGLLSSGAPGVVVQRRRQVKGRARGFDRGREHHSGREPMASSRLKVKWLPSFFISGFAMFGNSAAALFD